MPQTTNPLWWTLAQMLVWILLQFELSPQDAEQYCNDLRPQTIEATLNALVGALFNALYGVAEGMPMAVARVPCGRGYQDLAAFFPLPPSLDSGALNALKNELRRFIRQQPDIQFNPTWGRWMWPVSVSAAPAASTPTRPTESAVAESVTAPTDPSVTSVSPPAVPPTEGSETASSPAESPPTALERANEETTPGSSHAAASTESPANLPSGGIDPAIRLALVHAIKRARPARAADVPVIAKSVVSLPALLAKSSAPSTPDATPTPGPEVESGSSPAPATNVEVSEPVLPSTLAVSKSAQSSLEVPAPVSPPSQEPTPIALLVKAALVALATELEPKEPEPEKPEPKGWQAERMLRFLRKCVLSGKTSRKQTHKELRANFAADPDVIAENKKRVRPEPSDEVISACRDYLGYSDD